MQIYFSWIAGDNATDLVSKVFIETLIGMLPNYAEVNIRKKEHGWLGIKTLFKRTLLDLEVDIWFRVAIELKVRFAYNFLIKKS